MRYREIIETSAGGILKPLSPEQLAKRNDRIRQTQQRIADERTKSAAKVRELKSDLS
jgi:hypothetical protein